jgi:hypothetical protein
MARYDYGLRGYRETAPRRGGSPWHLHGGPEDPRDGRGYRPGEPRWREPAYEPIGNRVTARYNRDYVDGYRDRYPVNYNPYGGDSRWRMGDYREFERPYMTKGGSYTYRGGRSVGWERREEPGAYRRVPRYRDYGPEW